MKCKCYKNQQDGKKNICKYDSTIYCMHYRPGDCRLHDCIAFELNFKKVS